MSVFVCVGRGVFFRQTTVKPRKFDFSKYLLIDINLGHTGFMELGIFMIYFNNGLK